MRFSVKNLWEFTKDRPPLVVVFICLIAVIITTYSFAFYMEQDIPILDSDVKRDWTQMLTHFNKLETCLEDTSLHQTSNNVAIENERTVQTILTIKDVDILRKYTYVSGYLSTKGWEKSCQKHSKKPNDIEIFFHVPNIPQNITKIDLCVNLRAPFEYLPLFTKNHCNASYKEAPKKPKSHALLTTNGNSDDIFCTGGSNLKMDFKLDKHIQFANYLDDDVKTIMYIRMVWVCFIGIVMVFVMILYALAYEPHELKKDML